MKEYAKAFYQSSAWKRARKNVIIRSNGLCERCMAAGIYKPGVIVHHKAYITPGNINDANITLNLDNLEYICEDCHNKEHKAKTNTRYRFDTDGRLLPPAAAGHPRYPGFWEPGKNRGSYFKKALQGRAYMRGVKCGRKRQKLRKEREKKAK